MNTTRFCYVPSTLEHAKAAAEKSPAGAQAKPSKADAERGQIYHDHLVENLVKVVKDLQNS